MNQAKKAANEATQIIQESDLIAHKESFYRELEKKIDKSRKIFKRDEIKEIIDILKLQCRYFFSYWGSMYFTNE